MGDALVRLRLLLEQNFNFIETIGVVAVSRYLFELSVWIRLFERDARYGLVYYAELLDTQQKYFVDLKAQLDREVRLLKDFDTKEQDAKRATMRKPLDLARVNELKAIEQAIDEDAARHFSIYAEQAKVNGYSFQAFLVQTKAVPETERSIAVLRAERADFDSHSLPSVKDLLLNIKGKPRRWDWKDMADKVGLLAEYEFLYTSASKLLHATPVSITTDHKNLEPEEFLVYLRYVNVKVMEMLDLAGRYPRDAA